MDLKYLTTNSYVPLGRVASTARKGRKWFDRVTAGDIVNLVAVETGDCFGRAAVVEKELVTLKDVLDNADHNQAAFNPNYSGTSTLKVKYELTVAYGSGISRDDEFTILHLLPLNEPQVEDTPDEVNEDVEAKIERTQTLCDACDLGLVVGAKAVTVTEAVGDVVIATRIDF